MIPLIDIEACSGCGLCVEVCPPQALSIKKGHAELEKEYCEECGLCASICPNTAIKIVFPMYETNSV